MPYQEISAEKYKELCANITRLDEKSLYRQGAEVEQELFCTSDHCEAPIFKIEESAEKM